MLIADFALENCVRGNEIYAKEWRDWFLITCNLDMWLLTVNYVKYCISKPKIDEYRAHDEID